MIIDTATGKVLTEAAKSYPIRDIFRNFYPAYAKSHEVSSEQEKAALSIGSCKSGDLGYNICYCENCGRMIVHASSCNNRNCPCCQSPQEKKWVLARDSELIGGCAYYHVILTLPHELNSLIYENQKALYGLMFSSVSNALLALCRDKKYMGAPPGIIMVLHTWGQKLNYHPHIHCCISGGGLTSDGKFKESRHKGFLIPEAVLGCLFRGKFMHGLKSLHESGRLNFSGGCENLRNSYAWKEFLDTLYAKEWVPFVKETFNGNGNAIKYLGRYAYRTAIANSRIVSVTDSDVTFRYKDYADGNREKTLAVSGTKFIDMFLRHILPKGFSRIRYAGFLSNCCKTRKLRLICLLRRTVYRENPVKGLCTAELLIRLYGTDICHCQNWLQCQKPEPTTCSHVGGGMAL